MKVSLILLSLLNAETIRCDLKNEWRRKSPGAPEKTNFSINIGFAAEGPVKKAPLTEIDKLVSRQDYRAAFHMLNSICSQILHPPVEMLYNKAWLLSRLARKQEALDIVNEVLIQNPDNVDATYLKALLVQK